MNSIYLRLYNAAVFFYTLAIGLAAPYNSKAKKWVEGRKKAIPELADNRPVIWMHCASAGEFQQGRPILKALGQEFQRAQLVVSFYSPSGYEFHREDKLLDAIFYLPADSSKRMSSLIDKIDPDLFVGIKYEFWYHLFDQLQRREVPVTIAAVSFQKNQRYFGWQKKFWLNLFEKIDLFFVQNIQSTRLLREHGINQTVLAGDPRKDQVKFIANADFDSAKWKSNLLHDKVLVAGSTWAADDDLLMRVAASKTDWSFVVVPHEITAAQLEKWEQRFPGECSRSSTYLHKRNSSRILIVDEMGILAKLYRIGDLAYVGGGFGAGIHNILEPAAYGLHLHYGPRYDRFQEAVELIDLGAATVVSNAQDLIRSMERVSSSNIKQKSAEIMRTYLNDKNSPSEIILQKIKEKFGPRLT